jgi:hypothetical protein
MEKLAELNIKDNVKLVLSKGEYRGSERVDLRQQFLNEKGEWIITKKGINFNAEWIDDFLGMLEKLKEL